MIVEVLITLLLWSSEKLFMIFTIKIKKLDMMNIFQVCFIVKFIHNPKPNKTTTVQPRPRYLSNFKVIPVLSNKVLYCDFWRNTIRFHILANSYFLNSKLIFLRFDSYQQRQWECLFPATQANNFIQFLSITNITYTIVVAKTFFLTQSTMEYIWG